MREAVYSFDVTFTGKVKIRVEPRPGETENEALSRMRREGRARINEDPRAACAGEGVESVVHAETEFEFSHWSDDA